MLNHILFNLKTWYHIPKQVRVPEGTTVYGTFSGQGMRSGKASLAETISASVIGLKDGKYVLSLSRIPQMILDNGTSSNAGWVESASHIVEVSTKDCQEISVGGN